MLTPILYFNVIVNFFLCSQLLDLVKLQKQTIFFIDLFFKESLETIAISRPYGF